MSHTRSGPNPLPIDILPIFKGLLPPLQILARPLLFRVIATFFELKQLAGSALQLAVFNYTHPYGLYNFSGVLISPKTKTVVYLLYWLFSYNFEHTAGV